MTRKVRLAVVLSHPTQYYSPWFRWLAAHTDIDLKVFYLWDFGATKQYDPKFLTAFKWDTDLLAGYDAEFVPNRARSPGTHHFLGLWNPTLPECLRAWRPDSLLLFGYNWASHLRAIAWAKANRVPLLFRGDSHLLGRGSPSWARWVPLRILYAQFDAFLPVGAANREYFRAFGVPETRLFFAPHAVDTALYDPAEEIHRVRAAEFRKALGLSRETRVVLYAGKFVPEKQPMALLHAFSAVGVPNAALIFVGDGPERNALVAAARRASAGLVHFSPFANQSEMPSRYLAADIFALPSKGFYETWGLAVNEAMHMGRPALVSDRVGCQRDLVTPGETGWVFDANRTDDLEAKLKDALTCDLKPYAARVSARIAHYTYEQATTGLLAALSALRPGESKSGT